MTQASLGYSRVLFKTDANCSSYSLFESFLQQFHDNIPTLVLRKR